MISNKILEILACLSESEQERLAYFLQSPYHNSGYNSEKIIELYEYVRHAYIKGDTAALEKAHLNERYYPKHIYVDRKKNPIDALASDLFKKMKAFVFFEYVQQDNFVAHQSLSLVQFYRKNSYEERFMQVVKQFRKAQERRQEVDAFYYLDGFLMEVEVAAFRSIFNTYTDDANITMAHRRLDQFYATQKLECAAILHFQKSLGQEPKKDMPQTSELLESSFEEYTSFYTPQAELYKVVLSFIRKPPTNKDIESFAGQLRAQRSKIDSEKFRNLMAFYRYFLGMKYRQEVSGEELLKRIFLVYKEHLAEGYFLVDNKLLPISLHAIIVIATKLGEIQWAKALLKKYGPKSITGTRYPIEVHSISEAEVLFTNEEYEAAQDKLVYCNFENVHYSILADVLLLKIYYVSDNDLIHGRIQALDRKVRRSKLADDNKTGYLNFLQILNRILKYEHDKKSKIWLKLMEELKTTTPMIEREWLQSIV